MIIICGLPGTGKTTLCKKIEKELNYKYVSDWYIFNQNNVKINEFQNKFEISRNYSNILSDYIKIHKNEKLIIDLEYSLSPNDFAIYEFSKYTKIIYLGFLSVNENILFNLFKESSENKNLKESELRKKIEFYKKMSEDYFKECEKLKIDFIDINKDKNKLIEELFNKIKSSI